MKTLRQAVGDYLALRRSLGFKLKDHERCLRELIFFLRKKKVLLSLHPPGLAVCDATPAPTAGAMGRSPACSTGLCPLPQRRRSPHRDTTAGPVALSCPTRTTLSVLGKRNPRTAESCPESALDFHVEALDVLLSVRTTGHDRHANQRSNQLASKRC